MTRPPWHALRGLGSWHLVAFSFAYNSFGFRPNKSLPVFLVLSFYRSVYGSIYRSIYLSIYLPICLPTVSTYIPIYLPIYISTNLPLYLSTYLPIYVSTYISTYLPIYLPIYLSYYSYDPILSCRVPSCPVLSIVWEPGWCHRSQVSIYTRSQVKMLDWKIELEGGKATETKGLSSSGIYLEVFHWYSGIYSSCGKRIIVLITNGVRPASSRFECLEMSAVKMHTTYGYLWTYGVHFQMLSSSL